MKNGRPIRLALVDNDRCSAEMMALLIGRTIPEAHMLWVTDNPSLALERCLFDPRKPDILICDLMMDGLNGVRLTERIRQRNMQVGVIVVTSYDLATYGEDIACCGAQALISKRDFAATIREAVKSVFDGGTYPHGWVCIALKRHCIRWMPHSRKRMVPGSSPIESWRCCVSMHIVYRPLKLRAAWESVSKLCTAM